MGNVFEGGQQIISSMHKWKKTDMLHIYDCWSGHGEAY